MRILEFHLEVADLDFALEFYRKLIPHEKIIRWPDGTAAALVLPDGSAFGLWTVGKLGIHDGRGGTHVHFAFQIEPHEYDAFRQKLLNLGVEPMDYTWPSGRRSVYFFDRDGHQGEFITGDWLSLR